MNLMKTQFEKKIKIHNLDATLVSSLRNVCYSLEEIIEINKLLKITEFKWDPIRENQNPQVEMQSGLLFPPFCLSLRYNLEEITVDELLKSH